MSDCHSCHQLRAALASADKQIASKDAEINQLRTLLARQATELNPTNPLWNPNSKRIFEPLAAEGSLKCPKFDQAPSDDGSIPASTLQTSIPVAGPPTLLHRFATVEPSIGQHVEKGAAGVCGPRTSGIDSFTPPSSDTMNLDNHNNPELQPLTTRDFAPVSAASSHHTCDPHVLAATACLPDYSFSSDEDVICVDPQIKNGLFDVFGQKFTLAYIEKVLNEVRWNQEAAVSRLLAESESHSYQEVDNQFDPARPCSPSHCASDPSFNQRCSMLGSSGSVKVECSDLFHATKLMQPIDSASSFEFPPLDSKRLKVDQGPQVLKKLKCDICHEMESGRECLNLITQFQEVLPDKWFMEPLVGASGFPGPRIFHLACSHDMFSPTLAYLMDYVLNQENGKETCRKLMTLPVCAAFVDWNSTFQANAGAERKRTGSKIFRKQFGHDKIYSLGMKCCALHIAAHHGALSCASILLKAAQSADTDSSKSSLSTALLMQGGSLKDVKYRDWEPRPLDLASAAGHVKVMRLFVHHVRQCSTLSGMTSKLFVNHQGKGRSCALHWAAECSKVSSIEYLLQQGADPDARDDTGGTAVDYVINNASVQKPLGSIQAPNEPAIWLPDDAWLSQIQSFTKLLQYGASSNAAPDSPATSAFIGYNDFCGSKLQAAVLSQNITYLQMILYAHCDARLDIDCCLQVQKHDSSSFYSPLGLACIMGWTEGVLMLLEAGARQLPDERKKMTPLMLSAAREHEHIIRILVSPRFFTSMSRLENISSAKQGDFSGSSLRPRLHKPSFASRAARQSDFTQRYYPALLEMLKAKSADNLSAVDWAALRDLYSASAVFLRELFKNATSMVQSLNVEEVTPRNLTPSEPVILQRSFLSWEYMKFFALKHLEESASRAVSLQRLSAPLATDGCSCCAVFCVPGMCFCLKGDMNSRSVNSHLGGLREDGMNLDLNFSNPFVGDESETIIRLFQERGFSSELFDSLYRQMYSIRPEHYTDCNWLSIGTKLASPDISTSNGNRHSDAPNFSMINMIGAAIVLQILPRLLCAVDCASSSWRWRDPCYSQFRQEIVDLLSKCAWDSSSLSSCFASFKKKVVDLSINFSSVCEGSSSWGRMMLHDWQDFGRHLWRAEVLCCEIPLTLCHSMKELACRYRCMQSHLRMRVKNKISKHSPNVSQLLLCDASKCGCPCALTADQVMHLGVLPHLLEKRPSEYCQPAPGGRPGQGLYTSIPLQAGSLVAPYLGELMLSCENLHDEEQYQAEGLMCYSFELPLSEDSNLRPMGRENKVVVDPTRFGGLARYVNHSCIPNLDFVMVRAGKDLPVLYLYASTDIDPQTELTMSYGSQLTYPCLCAHCQLLKAKRKSTE